MVGWDSSIVVAVVTFLVDVARLAALCFLLRLLLDDWDRILLFPPAPGICDGLRSRVEEVVGVGRGVEGDCCCCCCCLLLEDELLLLLDVVEEDVLLILVLLLDDPVAAMAATAAALDALE